MRLYKKILLPIAFSLLILPGYSKATPSNDWVHIGKALMFQGGINEAIFYFSKAIEENPRLVKAYLQRGRAYLMIDKYHEAMADYQKAYAINPEYVAKHFNWSKRGHHRALQ